MLFLFGKTTQINYVNSAPNSNAVTHGFFRKFFPEEMLQIMEQLNEAQLAKDEDYIRKMNDEYGKAMSSIQKDIDGFYQSFATNCKPDGSPADAESR